MFLMSHLPLSDCGIIDSVAAATRRCSALSLFLERERADGCNHVCRSLRNEDVATRLQCRCAVVVVVAWRVS